MKGTLRGVLTQWAFLFLGASAFLTLELCVPMAVRQDLVRSSDLPPLGEEMPLCLDLSLLPKPLLLPLGRYLCTSNSYFSANLGQDISDSMGS